MRNAAPGPVKIALYQYGLSEPDRISLEAYDEAASLDRLTLNAGDKTALLKGTRLDQVARAQISSIVFKPAALHRVMNSDQLTLDAAASTSNLSPGEPYTAHVNLKDGRTLEAPVTVEPPRPEITLLSKGVQQVAANALPPVQFGNPNDLPVDGKLVFFLRSVVPAAFPRDEKIEVAADDDSFHTTISLNDGSLMLEDAATAVASVEPLARFGSSAFGPLRVRAVAPDGESGDWLPLGTLVRLPVFASLRCPRAAAKPCLLDGSNLFLATSVAATPDFADSTDVAPEFTGTELIVPHSANGTLYLKLRDDPATVQSLTLPVTLIAPSAAAAPSRSASPAEAPPEPASRSGAAAPSEPAAQPEPAGNAQPPTSAPPTN
jgi:hypothetical protein